MRVILQVYIREIKKDQIKVQCFDLSKLLNTCKTLQGNRRTFKVPIYRDTLFLKVKDLKSVLQFENDVVEIGKIVGLEATADITVRKYSFKSQYLGNTGEMIHGVYFILNQLKIFV